MAVGIFFLIGAAFGLTQSIMCGWPDLLPSIVLIGLGSYLIWFSMETQRILARKMSDNQRSSISPD